MASFSRPPHSSSGQLIEHCFFQNLTDWKGVARGEIDRANCPPRALAGGGALEGRNLVIRGLVVVQRDGCSAVRQGALRAVLMYIQQTSGLGIVKVQDFRRGSVLDISNEVRNLREIASGVVNMKCFAVTRG